MKLVMRPYHMISLGGYIIERTFPYRNLIVVNKNPESIKIEVPVFEESWIKEHQDLGLDIIPVKEEDNYLLMFKKAHAELDEIKSNL